MNNLRLYWFLVDFHIGLILVYLPVLLREYTSLGESEIGVYFFLGGIVAIIGALINGYIAHRIKNEANVLKFGSISITIGLFCLLLSNNIVFLFLSIFFIFYLRSTMYAIGDEISINYLKNKNYDFGKIRSAGSIGWGMNFLINGILVIYAPKVLMVEWIFISLIFIYVAFNLPNSHSAKHSERQSLMSVFKIKNYVFFLIATSLMFGCINNVQTYTQFLVQDMGGNVAIYGFISALAAILDFFVMQKSSNVLEKLGSYKYSILLVLILLVKFIVIVFSDNYYLIYFSILFDPFFFGLIIPFSSQFIKKMVDPSTSAMAITFVTTLNLLFGSILSLFFGYMYEFISPKSVFIVMALLAAFALVLMTRIRVKEKI